MKKIYIPILAGIIALGSFGCGKKAENATNDSLKADSSRQKPTPKILFTAATTKIMPAAADNHTNTTLTMTAGGNSANVSCYFLQGGGAGQTVTVMYVDNDVQTTVTFLPTVFNQWASLRNPIPNSATNVKIIAAGVNYNSALSLPVAGGDGANTNLTGADLTVYSDGAKNVAYVVIQDNAVTTP